MTTPSPPSPVVGEAQAPPIERFRKRAIEVEMMLWDGTPERLRVIKKWVGHRDDEPARIAVLFNKPEGLRIWNNQEKQFIGVPLGHRVAQGALGEFYPVSPAAIAETFDPAPEPLELTPAEQAAAHADLHYATCGVRSYDCQQCVTVLTSVHRYVKAAESVIAEEVDREADAFYVEQLCQFIYDHADTSEAVMHAEQFSVDELAELVNRWRPRAWQNFLWKRERTDGIDSDGAPVAAALDPTPIPDGEE